MLDTDNADQAKATVANIGLLLRSTGTPGITKVTEGATGFSIRSPDLGRQPVVVVAKGSRIAIGYGLASTLSSFQEANKTLADSTPYKEALGALGDTPIVIYVDGPSALNLATRWCRLAKRASRKPSRTSRRSTTWRSARKPPTTWPPPS